MKWFRKNIIKPESNETHEVDGAVLWYVRWERKYDEGYDIRCTTEHVMEAFLYQEDALAFAQSLREAHKLIRCTYRSKVTVSSNKDQ